ncbi:MAG: DNA-directed RNA polymerase subunit omega [Eubacterium sp.]|jgi:DNA-directed RNA polymerase subunit omega|nr:DNA-directed RNA polymerase subunit omega [Eubacterium sp.]
MLHPSYNDLMNVANSDVEPGEHPVVNSRYSIVLATAKRARQLIDGSVPLVNGKYPKPLSVAIEELSTSAIKINSEEDETEEEMMTLDEVSEEKSTEDSEI